MNIQRVIRVAVCAALCAVLVAGAGLFPLQTAAGKEANPVTRAEHSPLGRWAWHAPNPAAGYDAYITEEGVTIFVNGEPCVSLNLRRFGYAPGLRPIAPGQVSGDNQTINLTRDGSVQEWFVNSPEGLEQGFTFAKPPAGRRPNAPLRLVMEVGEGARATASADGRAVALHSADGGTVVEYGKLAAHDGTGRDIPARLTADGEQVFIEVEDAEAVYPLTIDPVFTLPKKLPAADGSAEDSFGQALALDGDTAVVGAYRDDVGSNTDQGSVYVFTRGGGGDWTLQQKLTASDGEFFARFGHAIALDGDTLVVGAREAKVGANYFQGAAYVFTRTGGVWTEQQKLTANDGAESDSFGSSVAVSGDTLVVGAINDTIGSNYQQGSAYVYTRSAGVWTQQQKLTAPNGIGAPADAYGNAVALNKSTLVVGAYLTDVGHLPNHGAVYVYAPGHAGWVLEKRLVASDREFNDFFGYSVSLDGETLAVGAVRGYVGGNFGQGSAYVFSRSSGVWTEQQKLVASDGEASDNFGFSVSLRGDTLAVGARVDGLRVHLDHGAAYVFKRGEGGWTQQRKITAVDAALFDDFGHAVAVNEDSVMVAAPGDDIGKSYDEGGDRYDEGSVYVFKLPLCPTLMFKPETLSDGQRNVSYQQALTISGGAGTYEFLQLAGSLPPGVSLSTSGVLSGMPTKAGTYHFTLVATDTSSGCGSVRDYTLTILN